MNERSISNFFAKIQIIRKLAKKKTENVVSLQTK